MKDENSLTTKEQRINIACDLINDSPSINNYKTYPNLQRTQKTEVMKELFCTIESLVLNKHESQDFFLEVLEFAIKQLKSKVKNDETFKKPNFLIGNILCWM